MKGERVSSQTFPTPEKIQGTGRYRGSRTPLLDEAPVTLISWGNSSNGKISHCPSRYLVRGRSAGPGMEPLEIFPAEEAFVVLHSLAAAAGYEFEDESTRRAFGSVARELSLCQLQRQALLALQVSKISWVRFLKS